ncbi:MAG TPA: hypothetical protein VNO50_10880 [Pyrinomonadaceae bacterium]|nr:hypothetical protein [Pyrinomonadaceae bacterium]
MPQTDEAIKRISAILERLKLPSELVWTVHNPPPPSPGIYVLLNGPEIVYVGQSSICCHTRLPDHRVSELKFETAVVFRILSARRAEIENALIKALQPRYNRAGNPRTFTQAKELDALPQAIEQAIDRGMDRTVRDFLKHHRNPDDLDLIWTFLCANRQCFREHIQSFGYTKEAAVIVSQDIEAALWIRYFDLIDEDASGE